MVVNYAAAAAAATAGGREVRWQRCWEAVGHCDAVVGSLDVSSGVAAVVGGGGGGRIGWWWKLVVEGRGERRGIDGFSRSRCDLCLIMLNTFKTAFVVGGIVGL